MAKLIMETPDDDPVRDLEEAATEQRKNVQQRAVERSGLLIPRLHAGTKAVLLRVVHEPPHPTAADVEELEAAILAGRLAVRTHDLF